MAFTWEEFHRKCPRNYSAGWVSNLYFYNYCHISRGQWENLTTTTIGSDYYNWVLLLLHKSHNALIKYPTIHHFVTEMCTCVHISVTKWCIVGYLSSVLLDLWDSFDMNHICKIIIVNVGHTFIQTHNIHFIPPLHGWVMHVLVWVFEIKLPYYKGLHCILCRAQLWWNTWTETH